MLSPAMLKKLHHLHVQTTHLAKDLLAGAYKSAFKGKGMEFEENREYQPGDEIRAIDWNVTARMNSPYIKNFREEREISVILMIDVSASSRFGSGEKAKAELMAEIGGVLAFSAIQNHDKIGLILFSDQVEKYIPPRKGSHHVLRIIREIFLFEPLHTQTDMSTALQFLGTLPLKRGVCFLISDFICADYTQEASLIAKKHDLIAIGVSDPLERDFPNVGLITLENLETGEREVVDTSDRKQIEAFRLSQENRLTLHHKLMNKIGASFIPLLTHQPYIAVLKKFFKMRGKPRGNK